MLALHWTEAKMSDFDRFVHFKSKFQLLKHEIAEKVSEAETQSAALEESLRINRVAKAKRMRGGSGGGGRRRGGEEEDEEGVEFDDMIDDLESSVRDLDFREEEEEEEEEEAAAATTTTMAEESLQIGAKTADFHLQNGATPSSTRSASPRNDAAIANMLAACESAGGYSDL